MSETDTVHHREMVAVRFAGDGSRSGFQRRRVLAELPSGVVVHFSIHDDTGDGADFSGFSYAAACRDGVYQAEEAIPAEAAAAMCRLYRERAEADRKPLGELETTSDEEIGARLRNCCDGAKAYGDRLVRRCQEAGR